MPTGVTEAPRYLHIVETDARQKPIIGPVYFLAPAAASLSAALLAFLIHRLHLLFAGRPETAVQASLALLVTLTAAIVIPAVLAANPARRVERAAASLTCCAATSLVAIYLYWVSAYVTFPADFLIWSESDYVNDILKLRSGYPLFTDQANNESFNYMPGSQLLTWLLASIAGLPDSIAAYRAVQIFYVFLAGVVGLASVGTLCRLAGKPMPASGWWSASLLMLLFLIGTNGLTSPFSHALHNDSLAVLFTSVAFWLLLQYADTRSPAALLAMALLPAIGFWVKQNFLVWYALYGAYLVCFDRPRSLSRIMRFAAGGAAAIALSVGTAFLLWGQHFYYWAIYVLGKHGVSPLRSLQHVLDAWVFFAVLFAGPLLITRGRLLPRPLAGCWLVSAALLALSAYTSGIAWMLNHMAPACLLAGVWMIAALATLAPAAAACRGFEGAVRAAGVVACLMLLLAGLHTVRIPLAPLTADAHRYARDIELQAAAAPESTLLDVGTWLYVPHGVVMKDRAPSIGERGVSQTGDFSGMLARIARRQYSKILVRSYHNPDFWYDSALWARSSGIRQALQANYRETAVIRAPAPSLNRRDSVHDPYLFSDISVLEPRQERKGSSPSE